MEVIPTTAPDLVSGFLHTFCIYQFLKVYNSTDEIYIKIRVELFGKLEFGNHTTFVMSFHFAEKPFTEESFPYRKEGKV